MTTNELLPVLDFQGCEFKDYHELVDYVEKQSIDHLPQVKLPLTHRLAPGQYSREMFAPAGTLLTSKIHAQEHFFFLMKGKILVMEEDASYMLTAPIHSISMKSARRIGLVIEDTVWITVHATSLAEDKVYGEKEFREVISKIEDEVIEPHVNKLLTV